MLVVSRETFSPLVELMGDAVAKYYVSRETFFCGFLIFYISQNAKGILSE